MTQLMTFGHGTLEQDAMLGVLLDAGVTTVVDVRRFPGSRRHPHVATEALARWLPEGGIEYVWEEELGGRRRLDPEGADADPWWQVEAFAAYAAYTRTPEFAAAMTRLLDRCRTQPGVVVMCSESVWWRCHRRLVSDVAVLLHDVPVQHLAHSGRLTPHPPAAGARVTAEGLRYDVGA